MVSIQDDRQFVDSILAGHRQGWERLVQRFSGMAWRIVRGECGLSTDQAEDAFQEIFLRVQEGDFRRLRQWRGHAPLDAYMVVVVRRLARDVLRVERRAARPTQGGGRGTEEDREFPEPEDPDPTPEEVALQAERHRAVQACREGLATRDQELLQLRYDLALKYRTIATRMRLSITNVGVSLARAEERLRQCLQRNYPELFGGWKDGLGMAV